MESLKAIVRRGILLAAGASAMLAPGAAHALTCGPNWVRYPADGAAAVPTDTLLWGYTQSSDVVVSRLIGPAGELAVEQRYMVVELPEGQRYGLPVLVPGAELAADTRYAIETTSDGGTTERLTFTTGGGPVGDASPRPPVLVGSERDVNSGHYVYPNRGVSLEFAPHFGVLIGGLRAVGGEGAPDLETSGEGWLIERSLLDAALELPPAVSWLSGGNVLHMGVGDCLIWPESVGDRIDARFGVLDVAGNFSGWVEMPVEIPSHAEALAVIEAQAAAAEAPTPGAARSSGCSHARSGSRGAASTSFELGLVAVAALRARAKRRRRAIDA